MTRTIYRKNMIAVIMACLLFFSPLESNAEKPAESFRFGVIADTFSGVNENDARIALNLLLVKQLKKEFWKDEIETVVYPDIQAAMKDVRDDRVDLLTLPALDYLQVRNEIRMIPKMISGIGSEEEQSCLLLVKKESNVSSLPGLNRKSLIVEKGVNGKLALKWLDTLLLEKSLPESDRFFREVKYADKSSRALLPVFFGQADACVVRSFAFKTMAELNPQVGKKLMVLEGSPVFGSVLLCFRSGIEKKLADSIIGFIQKMPDHIEHRQVLLLFQVRKIFLFKPEYLYDLENLLNRYNRLSEKSGSR